MFNQIKSMIWLRTQLFLANPLYLILVILPYTFLVTYQVMFGDDLEFVYTLFTLLPMVYTLTMGQLITSTIAEEKEKNNLEELQFAGIKETTYIFTSLFYPFLFGLLGIILMPILGGGLPLDASYLSYLIINMLTGVAISLIFLVIAMIAKSVNQGQLIAIPIMVITLFLPVGSLNNEAINELVSYTYMGSYVELFQNSTNSLFSSISFLSLIVWIILLFGINIISYKKFIKGNN